ncbi:MAG: hypothetical protein IPG55_02265 [Saprospiraceae bacterium]|nr:hypothetical protein [Candidatus Defluviibacterium haderslevense]MBK7244475.1 hypothetical protein [Candidatus Defluviibacterium haderslevense]
MLDLDILRVKLDLTLEAETAESYKSWYTKNRLKNYLNGLGSENLEKNEISVNSFNELITRFPKNEYQYQIQTICIQPMNFNLAAITLNDTNNDIFSTNNTLNDYNYKEDIVHVGSSPFNLAA